MVKLVGLASRARPCAARTHLFGRIATPNGALRAPAHRSVAASYHRPKNINLLFPETKSFLQARAGTAGVEYLSTGPPRL